MPYRIETTIKSELFDAEGAGVRQKARNYFGIELDSVRVIQVVTVDADLHKFGLPHRQSCQLEQGAANDLAIAILGIDIDG